MPFKEKFTWVSLLVFLAVPGVYFAVVLGQVAGAPVAEIAYQVPMLVAIGVSILLTIAGTILMGIGTGIAIELSGNGSTEDIGRDDERDQDIAVRGQVAGSYAAAAGALGALVLAMLRFDQFWIANAIYLSFVASTVTAAIVKLVAYRRGF
jgi:hypothetical protein